MEEPSTRDETIDAAVAAFLASDGDDLSAFLAAQPESLREPIETACRDALALEGLLTREREHLGGGRTWTPVSETARPPAGEDARWIGEFQLLEQLGQGGMGVVYLAWQRSLDRRVALKVLPPGSAAIERTVERFQREVRAAGKLAHPGIVPVLGVYEADGVHHFAMEYVAGRSLAQHLNELRERLADASPAERAKRLDGAHAARVAELVAALAEALEYAHGQGIVHRDVKPQNVLIDAAGRPRICDFGLAKAVGDDSLSIEGELTGTPYYMSPEQADSKHGRVGARSDVYSLGVLLYEALTLQRPFEGETVQAVLFAIAYKGARPVRELNPRVPKDLETICRKAIEKSPERRYASAGALAADLRRFLGHEAIEARPPSVGDVVRRFLARNRSLVATVAIALLALAVALPWSRVAAERRALIEDLGAWPAWIGRSAQDLAQEPVPDLRDAAITLDRLAPRFELLDAERRAGLEELRARLTAVGAGWLERARELKAEDALTQQDSTHAEAVKLIDDAEFLVPADDPLYAELTRTDAFWPRVTIRASDGLAGDRVRIERLDPLTWKVKETRELDERTPVIEHALLPAHYRITVFRAGVGWAEATRAVFARSRTYTLAVRLLPTPEVTAEMIRIPAGTFRYGIPGADRYPFLKERDEWVRAFWIDVHEVSNGEYRAFVEATGHRPPAYWPAVYEPDWDRLPVVGVSYDDARSYAEWAGKRLPTAREWERAARGTAGLDWPWEGGIELGARLANVGGRNVVEGTAGDSPEATRARYREGVVAVTGGAWPPGPCGLMHTLGNVAEWTETVWVRMTDPPVPDRNQRIVKGGAWDLPSTHWTLSNVDGEFAEATVNSIGFRCAKSDRTAP